MVNPRELQVIFQEVNQRLNYHRHGMFVPESKIETDIIQTPQHQTQTITARYHRSKNPRPWIL